jgi:polygalacturonase
MPNYFVKSVITNLKVLNKHLTTHDGIDIDNSNNVLLDDIFVFSGDDSVCLKSGVAWKPEPAVPVHDITVRNAVLISGWNALQVGEEFSSDAYNVTYENIDVLEAYSGISVAQVGSLQNFHYKNVRIETVSGNYFMNISHGDTSKPGTIYLDNVTVDQAKGINISSYPQTLDIYINNLTVAGKSITSLNDLYQVVGNSNVVLNGNVGLYFSNHSTPAPSPAPSPTPSPALSPAPVPTPSPAPVSSSGFGFLKVSGMNTVAG